MRKLITILFLLASSTACSVLLLGTTSGLHITLKHALPPTATTDQLSGSWLRGWQAKHITLTLHKRQIQTVHIKCSPLALRSNFPFLTLPSLQIETLSISKPSGGRIRSQATDLTPNFNPLFQSLKHWPIAHLSIQHTKLPQIPSITALSLTHKDATLHWQGLLGKDAFTGLLQLTSDIPPYQWTLKHTMGSASIKGHGQSTLDGHNTLNLQWSNLKLHAFLNQIGPHALYGRAHFDGHTTNHTGSWHIASDKPNRWQGQPTAWELDWQQQTRGKNIHATITQPGNTLTLNWSPEKRDWKMQISALDQLIPKTHGHIQSTADLTAQKPHIFAKANHVTIKGWHIGSAHLRQKGHTQDLTLTLDAQGIKNTTQSLNIKTLHALWEQPLKNPTSNITLKSLTWHTAGNHWKLEKPTTLSRSSSGVYLSDLCASNGGGQACLSIRDQRFSVKAQHIALPSIIKLLPSSWQDTVQVEEGSIDGNLTGSLNQDLQTLQGEATITNLGFRHPDFKTPWHHGTLQLLIQPEQWVIEGNALVGRKGDSKLSATWHVKNEQLQGQLSGNQWVYHQPYLTLRMNPNIAFQSKAGGLNLQGKIIATKGHLIPSQDPNLINLPEGSKVMGEAPSEPSTLNGITGHLQLVTQNPIDVDRFMGFSGKLDGTLDITFNPTGTLSTKGACTLSQGSYLNIPHIQVERANITYQDMPLSNPLIHIVLSRTLRSSLVLEDSEPLTDPMTVQLTVTGRAQNPHIDLSANHGHLNSTQMMAALLSGNPYAISPTQNLQLALKLLAHKTARPIDQPLLEPFQKRFFLVPDEFYISTPLEEDPTDDHAPDSPQLHLTKYLRPNLILKTMLSWSDQNYLTSIDYLVNRFFYIQLYNTPRRQGVAVLWSHKH